jgi:hypothetical protein
MVERGGAAQLVNGPDAVLQRLGRVIEELQLVGGPRRAALGAGPVVGHQHDHGVVELAGLLQEVQQPPDLTVGVRQEAGVHLHHPRREPARLRGQGLPLRDVRVVPGQLRARGHDAQFLLPGEHPLAVGVPAVVELARVPVSPLFGHMMRGVPGASTEMQVERLVWGDLLGVGDELDGLVGQVLGQVIALFGGARRLDLVVVVDQVRVPLAGVTAQEPVEPLEAASQRPAVERPGRRLEFRGHQVVLADHVGAVAALLQHLRQEPVLERDAAVIARVAGRQLIDRRRVSSRA